MDVVTGGPSCQSFSLAGSRRKFDKRDNLFYHYLKVIHALRPKYFVMENVKGILTKDKGKIVERILSEIRAMLDLEQFPYLLTYLQHKLPIYLSPFMCKIWLSKFAIEGQDTNAYSTFFSLLENQLKTITQDIPYKLSKSNPDINTIRHGILLLKERQQRFGITQLIMDLKTRSNIANDHLSAGLNSAIDCLDEDNIISQIRQSLARVKTMSQQLQAIDDMLHALQILSFHFDDCIKAMLQIFPNSEAQDFQHLVDKARLYRIASPIVVLAADYGVPQNRERVLFIGCRRDQELITAIPATVSGKDKVTVFEALWDLDMLGNGETASSCRKVSPLAKYQPLLKTRAAHGVPMEGGKLYANWSRLGRLTHRFSFNTAPFYVKSHAELADSLKHQHLELFNHQSSLQ